jgi:hypothetical protein
MLRPLIVAVCSTLAVAGCVMPPTSMQRLSDSAYDLNTAVRFGRPDIANDFVREVAREDFAKRHATWGKSVRVVDLEMNGMAARKDGDADVFITVSWQRTDDTTLRSTDLTQRWTSTHGSWSLLSEEEHGGEKGLLTPLAKPKEDAAPPPPPWRPRYQTRVIYEQ